MRARFRNTLRNPLVIIPPFVLVLALGWQQYTLAGRSLNIPKPGSNLLSNNSLCEHFGDNGLPDGWQVNQDGSAHYQVSQTDGHATGKSCTITITDYRDGAVSFTTPSATVAADTTYLFKSYYQTSAAFSLVMQSTNHDGQVLQQAIRDYADTGSNEWTTAAAAFKPDSNVASVRFIFRLYGNGSLQINSPYVQAQTDVRLAAAQPTGTNLIPNPDLATSDLSTPDSWSTYRSGQNEAEFSYTSNDHGNYMEVAVDDYKDGQAKWQYPELTVSPGEQYQASITYRSTVPAAVTAEYTLQSGRREYHILGTARPADDWTTVSYSLDIPSHTTSVTVTLPLERNGKLASKQYQLINTTKGSATWEQPMVSLVFIDGWAANHNTVLPLLERFDFAATFYVNPTSIETPEFMTAHQLADLAGKGNEIAAHGYGHLDMTALDTSALDYQLREGRDYLRAAGYTVNSFAPPDGKHDPQTDWYAERYYVTQLGAHSNGDGLNTRQNLDPYNLKTLTVTDSTNLQTITRALQAAQSQNAWLILVYHQVADSPDYGTGAVERSDTTPKALQQQLSLIKKSGIYVESVDAAYRTLTQP